MNGERAKIQAMLDEGTITAEEAFELLAAVQDEGQAAPPAWDGLPARGEAWTGPFAVAATLAAVGGAKLLIFRKQSGFIGFARRFLLWPFTILAGLAALYIYLSRDAPWLHLRVREEDGDGFALSLPYPGPVVGRGLRFAREQADDPGAREKIDALLEALDGIEEASAGNRLLLDVDDDGSNVQIYLN